MPFTIEMTPRGVLLAGGFRTEAELNQTSTENKRNTMIVELAGHTNQSGGYFQGFNDDDLVGKLALSVFLQKAGIRDLAGLKQSTDDDQRNALIVVNNGYTDLPIGTLQGKNNKELVQLGLGWFSKTNTVAAILEFKWNIDMAKVAGTTPEVIAVEHYDNRGSSVPMESDFIISKEITNKSTFSHSHSLDFKIGASTKFTAGIPGIAENITTVSLETSTSNEWSFGEENSTTQKYERRSPTTVPPGKYIQRVASVTKGSLNVPYSAKVRTEDGSIKVIDGVWNGVSTVSLSMKQIDLAASAPVAVTI